MLSLGEIADTSGKFKQTVIEDKNRQFGTAREQLEKLFPGKTSGPDADDYKLLLQYYNNCDESFTLQSYALYSDHLEIIAQCYLPNVFKSMMPSIKLRYPYSAVKKHLKVKLL